MSAMARALGGVLVGVGAGGLAEKPDYTTAA
jgi:hypothetical protein